MRRQDLLLPITLLCLSSLPAAAQVKCTMPNGVTITRQIGSCPLDAVAAFTLDGKPLPKPADTPEGKALLEERARRQEAREKAATEAQLKQWDEDLKAAKARKDTDRAARDEQMRMQACPFLGLPPSQCETGYSLMLGANQITVATHLLPKDLTALCRSHAGKLRHKFFEGRLGNGWVMRLKHSPTGAIVAECPL